MTSTAPDPGSSPRTYQRHPLEIAPLVFGLVFLGVVAVWGLFELEVVDRADAAWILPIVLITAGALGILLAATRPGRTQRTEYSPAPQPIDPSPPETTTQEPGRDTLQRQTEENHDD
jgi:hypothetical protein